MHILEDVEGIGFMRFTERDVVRHPLVQAIIRAYERHEAARALAERPRRKPPASPDRPHRPGLAGPRIPNDRAALSGRERAASFPPSTAGCCARGRRACCARWAREPLGALDPARRRRRDGGAQRRAGAAAPRPTDVLSFSLLEGEDAEHRGALLGDVVIGVETAARQARAAPPRSLDEEVARLLIHGTLHLLGHDHEQAEEARAHARRGAPPVAPRSARAGLAS